MCPFSFLVLSFFVSSFVKICVCLCCSLSLSLSVSLSGMTRRGRLCSVVLSIFGCATNPQHFSWPNGKFECHTKHCSHVLGMNYCMASCRWCTFSMKLVLTRDGKLYKEQDFTVKKTDASKSDLHCIAPPVE